MRYRIGFTTDWTQAPGNVLEADTPFPAFASGDFINVRGQWQQITGVAHSFTQGLDGTQWANLVVLGDPNAIIPLFPLVAFPP